MFLLFEGYDELPEDIRTKNSIFLDVITGEELPEATLFITSRPWASEFLHREYKENISQHIEILGFTQDNIQSYLKSTTANDPSLLVGLKKYISCYPHIGSLMYIPLNSAIVVEVYRNSRKDDTLVPKTMTELYSSLVRDLLLRHLLDYPVHGKNRGWRVRSFNDLPQDVYQQLCELGRIAYEGILHDRQVIFSDLPDDFETLGLMQCAPELYVGEGTAVSYNFLHLTVQEYLAAFHFSQQPVEKQIEHFKEYMKITGSWSSRTCQPPPSSQTRQPRLPSQILHDKQQRWDTHFHMVLQFLCGLRKFKGYPSKVLNTLCAKRCVDDSANVVHTIPFDTLHWLLEAWDSDVIANVLGPSNIQILSRTVTPFDCFVLGYCVSHSNCNWKISCSIDNEGVEMLVQGAVEEETHCTGGISEINFSYTSEGVKCLLHLPKQWLNKLEKVVLCSNELDSESCAALSHLIPHLCHLKTLHLSDNPNIGQGGSVSLIKSLIARSSLELLWLEETGISVEDCRALSELLLSSVSLKVLNIGSNALLPEAVEPIIGGLNHNATLEWLNMNRSHVSLQNTISLASVLRTNHTLVYLGLGHCNIDSDGACQLVSALCTNDTLQKLYLCGNSIGVKGATAFAEMLRTNHTLVHLNLRHCNIDSDGACQLASVLCTNDTLQELNWSCNPIGVEGATAFAEMLRTNHTLVTLNLGQCNIDSDGACQLASALYTNDTLQTLYLGCNSIGIKGATAFAEMLLKNKSLKKYLNLHDDSIGEGGTQKLIDSLTHNATVELCLPVKYESCITGSRVDSRVRFY